MYLKDKVIQWCFSYLKKKFGFYKSGIGSKLVQLVLATPGRSNPPKDEPWLGMRKETGQFSETLFRGRHPLQVP